MLAVIIVDYCYSLGSTILGVMYKDLHRMFATTSSEQDTAGISRFVSRTGGGEGKTIGVEARTFLSLDLLVTNRNLVRGRARAINFIQFLEGANRILDIFIFHARLL